MSWPRMIPLDGLLGWSAQQLYDQYVVRRALLSQLVGNLYSQIITSEISRIEDHAIASFKYHPNWFPAKGLAKGE